MEIFTMATATLTSKGQITIPVQVRTALGLETGDRVEFVEMEDGKFSMIAASKTVKDPGSDPQACPCRVYRRHEPRHRGPGSNSWMIGLIPTYWCVT